MTYGISLAVIGASLRARTNAALFKGFSLLLMGLWVFGSTIYRVFYVGVPTAEIMGAVGFLALLKRRCHVRCLGRLGHCNRLARFDRGNNHGRTISVVSVPDRAPSHRGAA